MLLTGCMGSVPVAQVPVRLMVTNQTAEPITVRWRDNKISGESQPIQPGAASGIDAQYTLRGAGHLRVAVLTPDGRTIRTKRFEGEELRAAKFSRKLTVTPPRSP